MLNLRCSHFNYDCTNAIGVHMLKVSNEELSKISQFLSSCDDMANGKFILADIKITKILNMIADSEELYRYISECLMGYDFSREYHRAEIKNGLNCGYFAVPTEPNKLVAFVFCLLVECDAKRIDFYSFINENFPTQNRTDSYNNFASKLLVPFKEIVAAHFGLATNGDSEVQNLTEQYRSDLQSEPVFAQFDGGTYYENDGFEQVEQNNFQQPNTSQKNDYSEQYQSQMQNQPQNYQQNFAENQDYSQNGKQQLGRTEVNIAMPVSKFQTQIQTENKKDVWAEICEISANVESSVYAERHLKQYLKEELLYILNTIKYATKYKDVKIISALVTAFDELSKKYRSIQFVFGELKNKLQTLY